MTPSCYAFTKSRRHTLLAASTSSSDPHPPDNPPDEIFFASSTDISPPSPQPAGDDEGVVINNQSDKSVLERYVENKIESVKENEKEKANNAEEDHTTIANDKDSVKSEPSEQKIIADEQVKREHEETQAKLAEEKRIAEEQAKEEWEEAQTKLAEELRIGDEQRKAEIREWTNKAMESIESAVKPLTDVQKGVSGERIKGAAIAGVALGLMASKGVIASSAVGLSAAYVAISKSLAGDVLRTVGGITWDMAETATKLADKLSTRDSSIALSKDLVDKTIFKYQREKAIHIDDELNVDEAADMAYMESEDDLVRVLKEAETVIDEADAAIAKAKAEAEKIVEEEKQTSAISLEDDYESLAVKEEMEKSTTEDFEIINTEDTSVVVEDELVEETTSIFKEEIIKKETEQWKDDEENATEDIIFDDDEFMAAVEIAQEGIEGKIVGVDEFVTDSSTKAEWDAAGVLANDLRQDDEREDEEEGKDQNVDEDEEDFFELDESDLETLAQAARDAVSSYENNAKEAEDAAREQKKQWADSVIHDDNHLEDTISDGSNFDNIAPETTYAVQEVDGTNSVNEAAYNSEDLAGVPVSNDWSSFTVAGLKVELKNRGLKTSGRKAELISLLEESDTELLGNNINGNADSTVVDDEENDPTLWEGSGANIPELDGEEDIDDVLEDFDIEELGRQARAAVEVFQQSRNVDFDEEPTEEMLTQLENEMAIDGEFLDEDNDKVIDISKMTVKELKVECKNRGLKVSGRKADLIERLKT